MSWPLFHFRSKAWLFEPRMLSFDIRSAIAHRNEQRHGNVRRDSVPDSIHLKIFPQHFGIVRHHEPAGGCLSLSKAEVRLGVLFTPIVQDTPVLPRF
jgi:hypothetical protein